MGDFAFSPPCYAQAGPLPRGHHGLMAGLLIIMLYAVCDKLLSVRLVNGRIEIRGHRPPAET